MGCENLHFSKEEVIYLRENQWPRYNATVSNPTMTGILRKTRHFAYWFAVNELEKEGNARLLVDCTRASHAPLGA